jgi:ribosomal protein L12E/L44/L45/RPP1/RPP2
MNNESGSEKIKMVTLYELMSETPVHGIGFERFNDTERKDVEALLSSYGVSMEKDGHVVKALRGSSLKDIMEYIKEPAGSERRKELQGEIGEALEEARERAGDIEDEQPEEVA